MTRLSEIICEISGRGFFLKKKDEQAHVLNFFFGDSKGIRELITQLYLKCKGYL